MASFNHLYSKTCNPNDQMLTYEKNNNIIYVLMFKQEAIIQHICEKNGKEKQFNWILQRMISQ